MKYRHATTWKTLENNMLTERQSQKTIHYMTQFIRNVQSKQVYRDEHNKGQKRYGLNRNRKYEEEVERVHRRTIEK